MPKKKRFSPRRISGRVKMKMEKWRIFKTNYGRKLEEVMEKRIRSEMQIKKEKKRKKRQGKRKRKEMNKEKKHYNRLV